MQYAGKEFDKKKRGTKVTGPTTALMLNLKFQPDIKFTAGEITSKFSALVAKYKAGKHIAARLAEADGIAPPASLLAVAASLGAIGGVEPSGSPAAATAATAAAGSVVDGRQRGRRRR